MSEFLNANYRIPQGSGFSIPPLRSRPPHFATGTTTSTGTASTATSTGPSISAGPGYGPVNITPPFNPLAPAEPGFLFARIYPTTPTPVYNPNDPAINPTPVKVPVPGGPIRPPTGPIRVPVLR